MRYDIIFRVSTTHKGDFIAKALRYPVEVRGAAQGDLERAARKALASYIGPMASSCRITLVRSHAEQALAA